MFLYFFYGWNVFLEHYIFIREYLGSIPLHYTLLIYQYVMINYQETLLMLPNSSCIRRKRINLFPTCLYTTIAHALLTKENRLLSRVDTQTSYLTSTRYWTRSFGCRRLKLPQGPPCTKISPYTWVPHYHKRIEVSATGRSRWHSDFPAFRSAHKHARHSEQEILPRLTKATTLCKVN